MRAGLLLVTVLLLTGLAGCTAEDESTGLTLGEQPPEVSARARAPGGGWEAFTLSSLYHERPIVVIFLDTDCSHCWNAAPEMSDAWDTHGQNVAFVSIAVNLPIAGHESSRSEVAAFQDKTSHSGCKRETEDCSTRGGEAHAWTYVDDLENEVLTTWGIPGTPSFVVLEADGSVAWYQGATDESWTQVLDRMV